MMNTSSKPPTIEAPAGASAPPKPRGLSDAASVYLDAIRAVASNLVVVSHVLLLWFPGQYVYRGGSLAVAVFFLLSGFLITQSMLKSATRPGPRLPGFLADRVARIMTPFVPVLVIVAVLDALAVTGTYGGSGLNTGVAAFIGNLFMLHDYPMFQVLDLAHIDVWWRIRPYQTAEPFWTVAIEFWLYVAVGLFFFCAVLGERIKCRYLVALALASAPVLVWNAAAGWGESLSLVWIVGGLAGLMIFRLQSGTATVNWRRLSLLVMAFGALALAGRAKKDGFDPHSLQIVVLVAIVMFGALLGFDGIARVPAVVGAPVRFAASYSYSLYLIHNTVLTIVFERTQSLPKPVAIVIGVLLAQVAAWLLYMAFERHYRKVAGWLGPVFARHLAPVGESPKAPKQQARGVRDGVAVIS